MAIGLAQKYDIKDVDSLLSQYAVYLKQEKSIFTVVELYKKACKFLHAALMLYKVRIPPSLLIREVTFYVFYMFICIVSVC